MKNYTKLLIAPSTLLMLANCTHKSNDKKPLNIIYIMTDDHTQQMVSCYDSTYATTPNIDRLAQGGVRFTNSFVANSISGPSRACMLTGKHSHKNGKVNNEDHFDGTQTTMPKVLQAAGYQTAIIGKWHLESKPTGFDHWDILHGQGEYYQPDFITDKDTLRTTGYVTDLITDKSIAWLEQRNTKKPFILFVHHKAPHRNWMAKTSDLPCYEDKTFPLPANFYDNYQGREAAKTAEMRISSSHDMDLLYDNKVFTGTEHSRLHSWYFPSEGEGAYGRMNPQERKAFDQHYAPIIKDFKAKNLKGKALAEWKYQRYIKDYLKSAKSVDDNIGRLLDYLEQNNMMDNTLIVYTSDQGFYMGEHGWFDKRFMYEQSFSTPLVMHLPKHLKKRGDIPQLVQNIDYAPTFLDLAGVAIPDEMQGRSMRPLLEDNPEPKWRKSLYYHFQEFPAEHMVKRHFGIRNERYKLIRFYNDQRFWEFYDLQNDPKEMKNEYANPQYAELIATMKNELKQLQEQYDDPIRHTQTIE
ncbi:MAG: sulfatase family protein [Bacteroidales bacterium]